MKILLFGATGMIGQGALRQCLLAPDVEAITVVGRTATGKQHAKLTEIVRSDLFHFEDIEQQLTGFDACLFVLGISSAGMKEADYTHITYDLTLAVAQTLLRLNPQMVFVYVSGRSTDTNGKSMWQRVKGRTEDALLALPFRAAYMFRPGAILPKHGEKSKTPLYNIIYTIARPLFLLAHKLSPQNVTDTEELSDAMLKSIRRGAPKRVLETSDIRALLS